MLEDIGKIEESMKTFQIYFEILKLEYITYLNETNDAVKDLETIY